MVVFVCFNACLLQSLKSSQMLERQRATALYLIDKVFCSMIRVCLTHTHTLSLSLSLPVSLSICTAPTGIAADSQLALRAGGEKDADEEADTVGCCSLRVEHISAWPA
jgi:hypothetical protein